MIRFQKHDPKNPKKQSEVVLDVMPLVLFFVGWVAVKALISSLLD